MAAQLCGCCCTEDPLTVLSKNFSDEDDNKVTNNFQKRNLEECELLLSEWSNKLHYRVAEAMEPEVVKNILLQIAEFTGKNKPDPILQKSKCVKWYGSYFNKEQPIMYHQRNDSDVNNNPQPIFVNRMLAFLFSDEDTFNTLKKLDKNLFPMRCKRNSCINVWHITEGR